jgi:hypothetical protein
MHQVALNIPGHTRNLGPIVHILLRSVEIMEVENSWIAVVLAYPDLSALRTILSFVNKGVLRSIPPSKAHVDASHERDSFVDDTHFLVLKTWSIDRLVVQVHCAHVGPVESACHKVRWRALDENIFV